MRMSSAIMSTILVTSLFSFNATAADVESFPGGEKSDQRTGRQCLQDLQAFDDKLEKVGLGVLPPGGGTTAPSGYYVYGVERTPRQKIQSLRDVAYIYALEGNEESCQLVLTSIRELYEEHQMLTGTEADDPEVRTAWRRAHLARTEPVTKMKRLMRADLMIGADIRNTKDEILGEIEDIVLDPASSTIVYVLVSRGGFLGWGGKLVAVRWGDLRATSDHEIYVLDVPASALDAAPVVDRRNFGQTANENWQRKLNQFWDKTIPR